MSSEGRVAGVALVLGACILANCQRSPKGGSSAHAPLRLVEAAYGRRIAEDGAERIVSPLTLVEVDPVTGRVLPGSLQTLAAEVNLDEITSLGLSPAYTPRVVPRNAVLVLEFSEPLAPASVRADRFDTAGQLVEAGAIQVRDLSGRAVPVELILAEPGTVWINPVLAERVGFPASPVNFDATGRAQPPAQGSLTLQLPEGTPGALQSASGKPLSPRADGLGGATAPIAFTAGNEALDFIAWHGLLPGSETFHGFLPDRSAPRLVRDHSVQATLDFAAGDSADGVSFTDVDAGFSAAAQRGQGEWASHLLVLRPGQAEEEAALVAFNTDRRIVARQPFAKAPQHGDTYLLRRAEYFEPDPGHPVDPARFDPANPERIHNTRLARFIEAFETDAGGNRIRGPLDPQSDPLPPLSILRLRFNEPMARDSFRAWESFTVTRVPELPGRELVLDVELNPGQTTATLRPALRDPDSGALQMVGWGAGVFACAFRLQSVPTAEFLRAHLPDRTAVTAFLDQGILGVTDLGGQPLAFPAARFDPQDPVQRYEMGFIVDESASTLEPPPVLEDWGVIVHRFRGQPLVELDPVTGAPGVRFGDQERTYGPVADVNLFVNGQLSAPPVTFVTKVHDDYFPPADGQFGRLPSGIGAPLRTYRPRRSGGTFSYDGIRFQHLFRDVDASPGADLQGTLMDLYRVSWSPIGGNVSVDIYDDVSVHAAHSTYRPITTHDGGGGIHFPWTGLGRPFDFASWVGSFGVGGGLGCDTINPLNEGPNHYGELVTVVPAGTPYLVQQASVYTIPGSQNAWHPWPTFQTVFQYNNGSRPAEAEQLRLDTNDLILAANSGMQTGPWLERRFAAIQNAGGDSLLLEYRIRPQSTGISGANGFGFSLAVLTTRFPFFRAFSAGGDINNDGTIGPEERLFPDRIQNDMRARCGAGPNQLAGSIITFADNARYHTAFDFVKTTARITSPYLEAVGTRRARFLPALVFPPLAELPPGVSVRLAYDGAANELGNGSHGFTDEITDLDGERFLAFRIELVGNAVTQIAPAVDSVVIPFQRR